MRLVIAFIVAGGIAAFALLSGRRDTTTAIVDAPRVAPHFDISKIVRDAHFAFRTDPASGALEGGDVHYRILVDDHGATLRAYPPGRDGTDASAPLQLATTSIRRSSGPEIAGDRPVSTTRDDGVAVVRHASIEETFRNDERGSEQAFRFAERPPGDGSLVVRVAVAGMDYRTQTADGLHFADGARQIGFRYGVATFVDATGRRSDVAAHFADGAIELEVPAAVVDTAAYPAVLDPVISPEIAVDQPVLGNAFRAQINPAIAYDGTNFVVVFQDPRVGFGGDDIFAVRVSPSGTILDPSGFIVAQTFANEATPLVACSTQQRCLASYGVSGTASESVVIDTAAPAAIAATHRALVVSGKVQYARALASDGTNFVLLWNDLVAGTNTNVRGSRISATTGALVDAAGFDIAMTARAEAVGGGVDCAGTSCVVAWSDVDTTMSLTRVRFSRFSTATVPALVDAGGILVDTAGASAAPRIARSGSAIGIAWPQMTTMMVRRFDAATALALDASPVLAITSPIQQIWHFAWSAGAGGFGLAVTMRESTMPGPLNVAGHVVVATVDATTGAIAPAGGVEAPTATAMSLLSEVGVASNGASYELVFPSGDAQSTGEIVAVPFTAAVSFGAPLFVSRSANDERIPRVAAGNGVYLVVWVDQRRASVLGTGYAGTMWSDIYAARVRASDGVALDPTAIKVSSTTGTHNRPDVAFDGTRFLVAYDQSPLSCQTCPSNYDVVVRRLDPASGALLDPGPRGVGVATTVDLEPAVCGANGRFFVAWTAGAHIAGQFIDGATGALAGTAAAVSPATSSQSRARATCGADRSLVVWQDDKSYFGIPSSDVFARRFDLAAGTFTDPLPISVSAIGPSIERYPVATRLGAKFVLAWEDNRQGTYHVFGARIDAASGVLDDPNAFAITTNAIGQADVGIAADGQSALVVFRDDGAAATSDIEAVRVAESGTVLDPTPVAIADTNTLEGEAAIAADKFGHMLVAYTRFVPDAGFGSPRIRARTVFYPRPVPLGCQSDGDCQSGFCEDGVCCATDCGNSNPTDCRACAVAAGASTDGSCGAISPVVCRPSSGGCDLAETCTGTTLACPPDTNMCDAGVPDAAVPDAAVDAAMPDAAIVDAAIVDAAVVDAAVVDAATADARVIDAAVPTGDAPGDPGSGGGGCGCETGTSDPSALLIALSIAAIGRRRRRVP